MTDDYRQRSSQNYRERQRGKIATQAQQIVELVTLCNTQQDEIDELKNDVATLKKEVALLRKDTTLLQAKAEAYDRLVDDYEALEAENREQLALIEELKARLGVD